MNCNYFIFLMKFILQLILCYKKRLSWLGCRVVKGSCGRAVEESCCRQSSLRVKRSNLMNGTTNNVLSCSQGVLQLSWRRQRRRRRRRLFLSCGLAVVLVKGSCCRAVVQSCSRAVELTKTKTKTKTKTFLVVQSCGRTVLQSCSQGVVRSSWRRQRRWRRLY